MERPGVMLLDDEPGRHLNLSQSAMTTVPAIEHSEPPPSE